MNERISAPFIIEPPPGSEGSECLDIEECKGLANGPVILVHGLQGLQIELEGIVTGLPYQAGEPVLLIRGKPFANIAFVNIEVGGGPFCLATMLLMILNNQLFKVD